MAQFCSYGRDVFSIHVRSYHVLVHTVLVHCIKLQRLKISFKSSGDLCESRDAYGFEQVAEDHQEIRSRMDLCTLTYSYSRPNIIQSKRKKKSFS